MRFDEDFQTDLARYPKGAFFREQSIWAIYVYRFGRRILQPGLARTMHNKLYSLLFLVVEAVTGISLPAEAEIGAGTHIHQFGCIFIHRSAIIGRNCTLRHGVTIGNTKGEGPVPVVGDDVEFGAHAQILGKVRIGNGAKIGAMSVVLRDVPPRGTAIGISAYIIRAYVLKRSSY